MIGYNIIVVLSITLKIKNNERMEFMNNDIRFEMFKANLKQFELALLLKVHEGTLSKMLNRKELTKKEKEKIIKIIEKYKEEKANG